MNLKLILTIVLLAMTAAACSRSTDTDVTSRAGPLDISDAWLRAMPPGAGVAAGYVTLHNKSAKDVRVVSWRSPVAESVEVHEMKMEGGQMRMRQLEGGLTIAAGQTVALAPGGFHLMFMGVKNTAAVGSFVAVQLVMADGSSLDLVLPVRDSEPEHQSHH